MVESMWSRWSDRFGSLKLIKEIDMSKKMMVAIAVAGAISCTFAGERSDHVDKRMSFDVGARQTFYKNYELDQHTGGSVSFDYAWKVGGIASGKSTWISIPISGVFQSDLDKKNLDSWILAYGWGITHELAHDKKVTPTIAYGLLLNQLHDDRHSSSIFGHETRFTVGADNKLSDKIVLFYNANYSLTRYPVRDNEKSIKARAIGVTIGVRLVRPGTVKVSTDSSK